MARTPTLGGFSLNLFGGGGVDASVFNIASQSRQNEAYLALVQVETKWNAGQVSDADYLKALETYALTFPENSSERINKMSSLNQTRYRIERNVLVSQVNAGSKTLQDLLTYDQSKLSGLVQDSQEYRDRLDNVRSTQNALLSDQASEVNTQYQNGKMTTTQLLSWYQDRLTDPTFANNPDLTKQVQDQVDTLKGRVIDERDAQMISDYQNGKITPTAFINYATAARARYTAGTTQAQDWDQRISQAKDAAVETDLSFRYDLSQEWLSLSQFVQSNQAPTGGTSTSTSTRTILGADGKWHVVTSTTTKATKPTAAQQKAYQQRQIEVAAAKKRMHQIENKLAGLAGGYVTTDEMITYYKHQRTTVAKGSQEWYAIQGKIDNLQAQKSNEQVMAREGIKVSYAKGGGTTSVKTSSTSSGGGGSNTAKAGGSASTGGITSLEQFMAGIAKVESGGRYDARNKTTGAYGKYQILPSNWAAWAKRAGLPAGAQPTPANQEKVATAAFKRLYKKYDGDYAKMAAEWFAGAAGSANGNSAKWGPRTRSYVAHVMSAAGGSYSAGRTTGGSAAAASGGSAASSSTSKSGGKASSGTPTLKVITGVSYDTNVRRRAAPEVITTADANLPTGLTSSQFNKVYSAVEAAFKDGSESATVDLGGGQVMHLFIGNDPATRIDFMRGLDDMKIGLADTEAKAYRGTGSEATKSQAAISARIDAAQHELIILDTAPAPGKGSMAANKATAPVAAAVRMADSLISGITNEVDAMNEAYKNGDLTAAYLHGQAVIQLTQGNTISGAGTGKLVSLLDVINLANSKVNSIVAEQGLSLDQLLTGAGPAGTALKSDLDRLGKITDEVKTAAAGGDDTMTKLSNQLKTDASGNVMWTGSGPRSQVQLKDNQYLELQADGTVDVKTATGTSIDPTTGRTVSAAPSGMVKAVIKTSQGGTADAYTKYTVGNVGYVIMPDGSRVKLTGKIVSVAVDTNGDGVKDSVSTTYENPLSPGKWSTTPIFYNAPQGTTVVFKGSSSEPSFQFDGGDGNTATLQLDAATGTYQVWAQGKPNLMGQAGDAILLGTGTQNLQAQGYLDLWSRDMSTVSTADQAMSSLNAPFVGFSLDDYKSITSAATRFSGGGTVNVNRARGLEKANAILQATTLRDAQRLGQPIVNEQTGFVTGYTGQQPPAHSLGQTARISPITGFTLPPVPTTGPVKKKAGVAPHQALPVTEPPSVGPKKKAGKAATIKPLAKPKAPSVESTPGKKRAGSAKKKKAEPKPIPQQTFANESYVQRRTGGF